MDAAAARAFYAESRWGNLWGEKGPLYDPVSGHKGHDIKAAGRSLVPALRSGRVTAIYRHPVIGWVIALEHAREDIDGYCHIIQPLVSVGDIVDEFDAIARVATWGDYTGSAWGGPHLHLVNASATARIHMGPTRDPAPTIRNQLLDFAGGGGVPIESEEDDMFTDSDRALLQGSRPIRELVQTPNGTVWYCFERIIRYGIPAEANLATYQAHLRTLGYDDTIVAKSDRDIRAYGTPVFVDPLSAIAAAVDARIADEEIQAAIAAGGVGGAAPLNLEPVLEQLRRLPADMIAELKSTL